ncbi:diguanylate cyclase [Pseudoalteromonas sp. MMG012]|nr:diguanylate cyclase [Pseudoalteromonas sp. MMG012]
MSWLKGCWCYCMLLIAYEAHSADTVTQQKQTISAAFEQLKFQMKSGYELSSLPQLRVIRSQAAHYAQREIVIHTILIEASIRQHFGDYKHSLSMHYEALDMAEQLSNPRIMVKTLLAVIDLELDLERFDHAARYINRVVQIGNSLQPGDELLVHIKLWQARTHLERGSFRQAQYELDLGRKLPLEDERLSAELLLTEAQVALKLGDYLLSQTLLSEFSAKYMLVADTKAKLNYQLALAASTLQAGMFTEAIALAMTGLDQTFHTRYLEEQSSLQRLLASAFAQVGNYQQAHLYLKRYSLTERALDQQKRNNKVLQLEAQYALAHQQQQVSLLEKDNTLKAQQIVQHRQVLENSKLTQQRWLLIGVLCAAAIVFVYWRWQNIRYTTRLETQVAQRTAELKERNERLQALSFTDSLTGLNNRHYFFSTIDSQINALKPKHDIIFCMIDIDHFKRINDTYGHAAGDLVLQSFADILKQCTRSSDLLVRWGGEEFLLVMPDMSTRDAQEVVERIRQQVERFPFIVNGETVQCTCSIGFAPYPLMTGEFKQASWEQVLELADSGLYLAKEVNRNTWIGLDSVSASEPIDFDYLLKNYKEQVRLGSIVISSSYEGLQVPV